ncbi:hypothetical protein CIW48_18855 [Methylobacterium sp. P1-11]|nr:hypothetical protein CIW48_18855 [Methylobacterium sp. P1-11]
MLHLYDGVRPEWGDARSAMVDLAWIDGVPGSVSRERGSLLRTTAIAIGNGRINAIQITGSRHRSQSGRGCIPTMCSRPAMRPLGRGGPDGTTSTLIRLDDPRR